MAPKKRRRAEATLRLAERAGDELQSLLRDERAGRLTEKSLETGLVEIFEDILKMLRFIRASL